jgi:hypothetical protein
MQAHKMSVTIPESRHVEFDLPGDAAPAGNAEIIVLYETRSPALPRPGSREAILAMQPGIEAWRAANPDKLKSVDEIDAYLAEERASWGDDP